MSIRYTFVEVRGGQDGIGKLVDSGAGFAEIEYFESPAGPKVHRLRLPVNSLQEVTLPRQTRVFWLNPVLQTWVAGRVDGGLVSAKAIGAKEDHYHVRFPNDEDMRIPISDLYVRWSHPINDPTEYLAARITETPFFFDGRCAIVRHIAEQRVAYGGLTSLASSAVELLEHQISVARRVLGDPIERYLLADEVGLGKTIEAGILIRQHLIDRAAKARVLIIVPMHLVPQWKDEISKKFYLGRDDRVEIVADSVLANKPQTNPLTMLVVDEAHHIASWAFSNEPCERRSYDHLKLLATATPGLLLLSGTPVLHQEDGFLAMLHLLDPDTYALNDREAFRSRIEQRQPVAEAMSDLAEDASSFFVEDAIVRLEDIFGDDVRLRALCSEVRERMSEDIESPFRVAALRALRTHLGDTYRLHRRLLRTRRGDPRVQVYLPSRTGVTTFEDKDDARLEAFDFLESWRFQLEQGETSEREFGALFAGFVSAALSHPRVLLKQIEARLAACNTHKRHVPGVIPDGSRAWAFEKEKEFLEQRLRLIRATLQEEQRGARLAAWLMETSEVKKAVVFIDDSGVADLVASKLEASLTGMRVIRHRGNPEDVTAFESSTIRAVLVCDATVEEGLNLQRSGAVIVHYDLPLDPVRIEQRIGRLDRIEARGHVKNIVFSSGEHYEREWLTCVRQSIKIFERSIAPLQYALAEATGRIRQGLVRDGYSAIDEESVRLSDADKGLEAELRRIQAQEAIDSLEISQGHESEFFSKLIEEDESISDNGQRVFNSWVTERLQFGQETLGPGVYSYFHDTRKPTLMPLISSVAQFRDCIDLESRLASSFRLPTRPVTFDRAIAEARHVGLLRVGHPFMDALESLVRNDDRGTAFAMWRYVPKSMRTPTIFFRFDFLIEANLEPVRQAVSSIPEAGHALRRRADESFPPNYRTVWLSGDLEQVTNPKLLGILNLPYSKFPRPEGGKDVSVRTERWDRAAQMASLGDWSDLCTKARRVAESIVRDDPRFRRDCLEFATRIRNSARSQESAFLSRIQRLEGKAKRAEEQMALLESSIGEAIAAGVADPAIRVDSVGALILSSVPMGDE